MSDWLAGHLEDLRSGRLPLEDVHSNIAEDVRREVAKERERGIRVVRAIAAKVREGGDAELAAAIDAVAAVVRDTPEER